MTFTLLDPLTSLTLDEDHSSWKLPELETLRPTFFVPRLENKPQDPISESLDLQSTSLADTVARISNGQPEVMLPKAEENGQRLINSNHLRVNSRAVEDKLDNIWLVAAAGDDATGSKLKTWDALRSTYADRTDGGLISEQNSEVISASHEFLVANIRDTGTSRLSMLPIELFNILMTNVIGHSSSIYEWEPLTERFRTSSRYTNGVLIAHGFSEGLTKGFIDRCLNIGTCLRRLDEFVIRTRIKRLEPTSYAFLHSLETVVASFRKQLARESLNNGTPLSKIGLLYEDIEEIVAALAGLCLVVSAGISPSLALIGITKGTSSIPPYPEMLGEAPSLLSRIYETVDLHTQSASSRTLRATLAFLLSTTSRPFFRSVERNVGIGKAKPGDAHREAAQSDEEADEFGVINTDHRGLDLDSDPIIFPSFFSEKLKAQVIKASRGLKVLAAAVPNHPLLKDFVERRCEWVWDEDALDAIYSGVRGRLVEDLQGLATATTGPDSISKQEHNSSTYPPELASFRIFDLEPGAQWKNETENTTSLPIDTTPFQTFMATFPHDLPLSTPTLAHLADAILHPLQAQSYRLSNALLDLFLFPPLSLPSHISLLRYFVLLESQSFTYRLRGALFSESEEYQPIGRGTRARTRAKLGIKDARDIEAEAEDLQARESAKWGIGLGLGLSERGIWPPGGVELGFALRRVIIDSLEEIWEKEKQHKHAASHSVSSIHRWSESVVKEAEWRLGFAIRDLPVNEGREEWLNPSSLAALDFLYLDYKPPTPVGALITANVLSKYQRIFNFLLRLLRVETVSRGLFHAIIKEGPSFSNKRTTSLLLRFRFHTQAFVSTLISYVFDTVVGVHFNGFSSRLEDIAVKHIERKSRCFASSQVTHSISTALYEGESGEFVDLTPVGDVFELMEDHSRMLDKILGGCMLRTHQRALADLLEDILGIVLRLGTLVRDFSRRALREEEAGNQLHKLHSSFERKMITFTKVLRSMDEKSELRSLLSALATNEHDHEVLSRNGGRQKREIGLSDLLVRLDPGEWWKGELGRRAKAKQDADSGIDL